MLGFSGSDVGVDTKTWYSSANSPPLVGEMNQTCFSRFFLLYINCCALHHNFLWFTGQLLFALKEIAAGEEILINYTNGENDPCSELPHKTPEMYR